ncbi:MAG: HAMP domain-containing sensor histidine kinase [Actinomycetota bacterium]
MTASGSPDRASGSPVRAGVSVRAGISVRARITVLATALLATTLILAALFLVQLVRTDLVASAEETVDLMLSQQAAELAVDGTMEADEVFISDPFDLVAASVDDASVEVGLFGEDELGRAFGELYVDGELAAMVALDVETGVVEELYDPITGGVLDSPEVEAEIGGLAFEVFELGVGIEADEAMLDTEQALEAERAFLIGATPLDEIEESVDAVVDALIIIVPMLILVFAAATWWFVGRALRPVQAITDEVEAISSSNLDRRVPVPATGDEVAELATVMNRMLDRLERGGERQRQFSADASHELRSPLSTIRAAAEMLSLRPNSERVSGLADDIVAESDRMNELIGDLLELSRLDEDRRVPDREVLDLAVLLKAELRDDPVEIDVEGPVMVTAVKSQVQRLVRNLVDNASRHAESRVVVSAVAIRSGVALVVEDDGPGIRPEDRDRVFERFARLDDARTRGTGGAGLGLALVRAIVEHHDGTVTVDDSELGGARFTATLSSVAAA